MADEVEKEEISKIRKPSASLVTDVLLKSGRLEKEDINSCVKKTLQKAEEVKARIHFFLLFHPSYLQGLSQYKGNPGLKKI